MMKYSKYILFLFSLFMIAQASAQSRKAGPINSGFVFIDGEYIEPPYTVKRKGMTVYLNHIQIMQEQKVLTKEDFLLPKKEPGIPPELKKEDDIDKMYTYTYENTRHAYISAQRYYYLMNYTFDVAIQKSINYYKSLPNIKETNGTQVLTAITYSGDTGKIAISSGSARDFSKRFGPGGEGLPKRRKYIEYVNQQVQSIGNALKSGKIYFVFNDTTRFDDYARFYLSPHNGKKILMQLNTVCASDSLSFEKKKAYIKENILKSNQSHPYLDKIINNFSVDEERVKSDDNNTTGHLKKDMDNLNKNDEKPKSNNKNVNMAYSPQNINMNIGSPDPWSNRYFLHTSFDNLCLNLSELTIDQGYANPVYYVDYTNGDDNWGNLTYDNFINFANAGINFWVSHGTEKIPGNENSGYIEVIYANSDNDLLNWFNGNSQTGFGILHEDIADNNGWNGTNPVPYVLVAYPEVAQQYWSDDISTNKSITVFGVCYSYQNGFVAACGSGGACFGYEVNASSSNVINTMNNRLFKRLNGTTLDGGEFIRNTKDAMDDLTSIDGFKMYPSNAVISLCPTITEKYPTENATVASSVPSGHIKFDTWCDAGQSANNALSFDVQNGDISENFDVSWEGSDNKSNQINFQWSGTYGEVTVNVNPEYIRSYNGGQRLDYDGVTPNADQGSYTFTVDDDIPTEAPVADFEADQTSIIVGNQVNFTDLSTGAPSSWQWNFGDGGTSSLKNPSHTYNSQGYYTVSLSVTNSYGSDTETKSNYIHVTEQTTELNADFSASSTSITEGESIDFTDNSTGNIDTWSWTFEGGSPSTSSLQYPPTVTYDTYGFYDVSLTVTDAYGNTDVKTKTNYITVNSESSVPLPDFEYYKPDNPSLTNPPSVVAGSLLHFEAISSIATKWTYHFSWPGGESSIVENFSDGGDGEIEWETPYNPNNPAIDLDVKLCVEYATPYDDGNAYCSNVKTINLIDPTDLIVYYPAFEPYNNCFITQVGNIYKIQDASSPYEKVDSIVIWWNHGSGEGYELYGYESIGQQIYWGQNRVMSHVYNTIGHKTIKYQAEPHFQGTGYDSYIWGGVIVIDCDLTSTYSILFPTGFTNAVRSDWPYENWGGNVHIYGGSFEFNGLANDYLSQAPTTLSACNEIIINGDVEFVASGDNELVLETNDDPCLQGGSKSSINYANNKEEKPDKNDSKWQCYPNPVKDKLNVSVMLENKQDLHFKILNAQGQVIAYHNRKNVAPGKYLFRFDVKEYKPGMYFIKLNLNDQNNTQKIVKQ
jgi:PKD repeat protein